MTTNTPRDTKKSEFISRDDIPSGATYDFVYEGTNYKIPIGAMIEAFGTTGTLSQKGDPTQTPILNINGTNNEIRNLEDGPGVKASISPHGGALLEHNFQQGSTGSRIVKDITADSPIFRTLLAGAGISVAEQNGFIQIAISETPATSKTVIINEASDFPAAVGGAITLEAETIYFVTDDLTLSDRFIFSQNSVMSSGDGTVIDLIYTGTNPMFSATDVSFKVKDIGVCCPNSDMLAINDSTGGALCQVVNTRVDECDTIGTCEGVFALVFQNVTFDDIITNGILFTGNNTIINIQTSVAVLNGGTLIDLGTSTTGGISIGTSYAITAAGTTVLAGLPNSGNINAGGLGTVVNIRAAGLGSALSGIDPNDNLWQFSLNSTVKDTAIAGMASLRSNATETIIAVATTPVLLAGTFVADVENKFSGTAAGRLTHTGLKVITIPVTASLTGAPVSGVNIGVTYHLYKNGVDITRALATNIISSGSPKNTSLLWSLDLDTDDYLEIYVSNNTNTTNILVTDVTIRVG